MASPSFPSLVVRTSTFKVGFRKLLTNFLKAHPQAVITITGEKQRCKQGAPAGRASSFRLKKPLFDGFRLSEIRVTVFLIWRAPKNLHKLNLPLSPS